MRAEGNFGMLREMSASRRERQFRAKSGRSPTARGTRHIDPLRSFLISPVRAENARKRA